MKTHIHKQMNAPLVTLLALAGLALFFVSSFFSVRFMQVMANGGVLPRDQMVPLVAMPALFLLLGLSAFFLLRSHERKLWRMAFVDPVTGGYTRARFELEAVKKIREAPPSSYAIISMNVEKFKLVNHLFGLEAADRMLKEIYDNILSCMEEGEILCRDYADTFTMLVNFRTREEILKHVEQFTRMINDFNKYREDRYYLRVSLGVFCIDNPFLSIMDMQDRAALARKSDRPAMTGDLYRCVFYSDMERLEMVRIKDMENRMNEALENGDFHVVLQPKIALDSGRVAGAEALVRWKDREKGLISPGEFVPFFEVNGFINKLDLYVFEKVCALIRKWLDQGLTPVPVSINLSRAHLRDPDFLESYVQIRDWYGVPGEYLELELTESLADDNVGALADLVNRLHALGFRCSLDDFGSGYSSLKALKEINVDTIKLDSAFWASPNVDNAKERDIIRAVVGLARELGMRTVSEGVETLAQVEFLREISCDMAQGYVFSRPVPPERFERLAYGEEIGSLENVA